MKTQIISEKAKMAHLQQKDQQWNSSFKESKIRDILKMLKPSPKRSLVINETDNPARTGAFSVRFYKFRNYKSNLMEISLLVSILAVYLIMCSQTRPNTKYFLSWTSNHKGYPPSSIPSLPFGEEGNTAVQEFLSRSFSETSRFRIQPPRNLWKNSRLKIPLSRDLRNQIYIFRRILLN